MRKAPACREQDRTAQQGCKWGCRAVADTHQRESDLLGFVVRVS